MIFPPDDRSAAMRVARDWAADHQLPIAVAEMAVGAAILSWGVAHGAIEMGTQLVGVAVAPHASGLLGASTGAGLAVLSAHFVGNIGLVGMGGAIGVPAIALASGGAVIFALAGYGADTGLQALLAAFQPQVAVAPTSALSVGLYLLLDGRRRLKSANHGRRGENGSGEAVTNLKLIKAKVVARTKAELDQLGRADWRFVTMQAAVAGAGGAAAGSSVAAGSVTVLGSHAIGAAALSLGLISAPVWPVVLAGVAAAAAGGYVATKVTSARRR